MPAVIQPITNAHDPCFSNGLQDIQLKEQRHAEAEQAIAAKKMALEQNQRKVGILITSHASMETDANKFDFLVLSTMFTMPPEPRSCSTSTPRVTERTSPRLLASLVTTTLLPESKAHLLSAPRFTRLALPLVTSLWGKFANNRIIPWLPL